MHQHLPLVQRAYELARSGQFMRVGEITTQLKREGYGQDLIRQHMAGAAIRADLRHLCARTSGRSPTSAAPEA
jgi:hypothetical protein